MKELLHSGDWAGRLPRSGSYGESDVRPSPEALRGTSLEMPGPDRGPPYLPEHAYKANRKSV